MKKTIETFIIRTEISYRLSLMVTEIIIYADGYTYPVCPRCKNTLEREYQSYCDRCGQKLNWDNFDKLINKNKEI